MKRTYEVPLTGTVTVDDEAGTVEVEIPLLDLPMDLQRDYDHPYPDEVTDAHADVILAFLGESLQHHFIQYRMAPEGQ